MTNIAKVNILDEVNVSVTNLKGEHNKHFVDKYALFAANYFFNPKFKMGRWDGKIQHFSKAGRTFLYLLPEILRELAKMGYKIELKDLRTANLVQPQNITEDIFSDYFHPDTGQPIILRDYQVNAVNKLLFDGNGICLACTGSGKTLSCAALLTAYTPYNLKTITIVPDQNLIIQTIKTYNLVGLDCGEYSGTRKTLDHQHIVSTWQALQYNTYLMNSFDLVIVDEAHGLTGPVVRSIVCDHAVHMPYRFGFTGTLPKEPIDELSVKIAVGQVKYNIEAKTLIERGILAKLDIECVQLIENVQEEYEQYLSELTHTQLQESYAKFKAGYFPEYSAEKSWLQHNDDRIQWIADRIMLEHKQYGNVLCFIGSIPMSRKIASLIPGAIIVNGEDVKNPKKRQKFYDLFETNDDVIMLATPNIAGTGLSINRIFVLMAVDLGKSFVRVIQAIGRGLRTSHDKKSVRFVDISSDFKFGKQHLTTRLKYYKDASYPYTIKKITYKH